jgi:presqualene diphosphate synthase
MSSAGPDDAASRLYVRPGATPAGAHTDDAARAHVQAVVRRSGTSFFWSMRLLPRPKREAMFAIYAFCREVDDVADGAAPKAAKRQALRAWQAEIDALYAGRPHHQTTRALLEPIERFRLPRAEFEAMIEGMEMDAEERMRAPALADLERYCRCVAGAVGMLSVRVFGARGPGTDAGAVTLGEALQLTNILRDLKEDAARGRLYLPRELLAAEGIEGSDPARVLAHPALPRVCDALAARARDDFGRAERWLAGARRSTVRPALVMMHVYRRTLDRVLARGWRDLGRPVRVSPALRLWLAIRHGVL